MSFSQGRERAMAVTAEQWRHEADAIWSRKRFDRQAAADLVAAMIREGDAPVSADLLKQTHGTLKKGLSRKATAFEDVTARNRFGQIRSELYQSAGRGFGKRRRRCGAQQPARTECEQRALLELPPTGDLTEAEIVGAYRAAALRCHPDRGGDAEGFQQIVRARDALLKRWSRPAAG
jgi:hypothetical protein